MAKAKQDPEGDVAVAENGQAQMREIEISTKISADKSEDGQERTFTGVYEIPTTTQGAVDRYGEEVVYDLVEKGLIHRARAIARSGLEKGADPAEIQKNLDAHEPGARRSRGAAKKPQTLAEMVEGLSPEEIRAKLAELGINL
jgi:hypothetical protein